MSDEFACIQFTNKRPSILYQLLTFCIESDFVDIVCLA